MILQHLLPTFHHWNKKCHSLFIFLLIYGCSLFTNFAHAQSFDGLRISIKGGALSSEINDLETTILSEPFFINYSLGKSRKIGFTGGLGINWEFKNSITALHLSILYTQQGSELAFTNFEKDFTYQMEFNYQYLNFPLLFKVYPLGELHEGLHGLNVGAGPQFGLNLSPENIIYTSGGTGKLPVFGTDLQQQQQIRNVLKGKNTFGLNLHLGYEIRNLGLYLECQYHHGLTDLVQTEANAYNFIENKNTNHFFQITLGWEFFSSYPKKSVLFIKKPKS